MKDNCFGLLDNANEQPAGSCGVSELDVEVVPKASPPNVFIGGPVPDRLDSRLKHAGMTVFGKEMSKIKYLSRRGATNYGSNLTRDE